MTTGRGVWSDVLRTEFARRLEEERQALLRTLAVTDDELATLEHHQAGAPVEDAATETIGVVLAQLEGQQKHELDEIEEAIGRLKKGDYGLCEGCGWIIPAARLRAMPATRRCLNCQRRQESR